MILKAYNFGLLGS